MRLAAVIGVVLSANCTTADDSDSSPAKLADADPETMAMVKETLAGAVSRARIEIGPFDPLQDTSIAVLPPPLSPSETMSPARPMMFDITLFDDKCYLVARESGERYFLRGVECRRVS